MNKKLNTLLFLLVGTIVNIVVMLILLFLLFYLISFVLTPETNGNLVMALTLSVVLLSVAGSYLVYSRLVKIVNKKWNLEQWIEPLFRKKR